MKKSPKFNDYRNSFLFLSQYVDLKIKKNKVKFSALEKQRITNAGKVLIREGVIFFDETENKYYPLVKFVKSGKKEKVKGIKNNLLGRFLKGAKPNQKVVGNTIFGENHKKIFIPLDLSFIEESNEDGEVYSEDEISDFVLETLYDVTIAPKLLKADYFSIATINGWEIGRGNFKGKIRKPKTIAKKQEYLDKKEQHIKRSAQNQTGKNKKLETIARDISEIIIRIFNRNVNKYKMGLETISGLYLYKFENQRKPTKAEKKAIKGKKKKK